MSEGRGIQVSFKRHIYWDTTLEIVNAHVGPTSGIQESPMSMNNERALAIERQNLMDSRFCDIDCSQDPLLCSEYAWDMFEHHKEIERVSQINPNYMDFQCSYFNPRRRSLLVCSIVSI